MKRIITGLIVLLILCGVVAGAYFLIKDNNKNKNNDEKESKEKIENRVETGTYFMASYEENGTKYTGAELKQQQNKTISLSVTEDKVTLRTTTFDESNKSHIKIGNYSYNNEYLKKTDTDDKVYSYQYDKSSSTLVITKIDGTEKITFKKSNI